MFLYVVQNLQAMNPTVNQKLNNIQKMKALQCRMARAALEWTVRDLADHAGVSHDTVVRIEGGESVKESTLQRVRAAFEAEGVEFTNGDQPGVRMKKSNP